MNRGQSLNPPEKANSSALPSETPLPKQSHILSRVLSPAVRLWLRSQVEHVENLEFQIQGGDRQLLSGHIPQVSISAQAVIYRGLHLSQLRLVGTDIQVNLKQILRGKPLHLLHVVPVQGSLLVRQADLSASLQAPLLADALTELLTTLLRSGTPALTELPENQSLHLQNPEAVITPGQLTLSANLISVSGKPVPMAIRTGLQVFNGHQLQLDSPQWLPHLRAKRGLPLTDLQSFQIDLGSEVDLQELSLEDGQIVCRGRINVTPA